MARRNGHQPLPNPLSSAAVFSVHLIRTLKRRRGNRLEALKGALKGKHSIRINDQFRIVFKFSSGDAFEVEVTDYH